MCHLCQCPTGMQRAHMRQLTHAVSTNCGQEHLWIHGLTYGLTPECVCGAGYGNHEGMWLLRLYLWDSGLMEAEETSADTGGWPAPLPAWH